MESNGLKTQAGEELACCEPGCCSDGESLKATVREGYAEVARGEVAAGRRASAERLHHGY